MAARLQKPGTRPRRSTGAPAESPPQKHRLWATGAVWWCARCGSFSNQFAQKKLFFNHLKGDCKGPPLPRSTALTRLNRLKAGRHPKSGSALKGRARPLSLAELEVRAIPPRHRGSAVVEADMAVAAAGDMEASQ